MIYEEPMPQWDEQVETARAAMEQAFKTADEMADRIEALVKERDDAVIKRAAWELEAKTQIARAEQLAATNERLEAALRKALDGLNWAKAHLSTRGVESVAVNEADKAVYAALKGADHD